MKRMHENNDRNADEMQNTNNGPIEVASHERLTWKEIRQRYPDTWVVTVDERPVDDTDDVDDVAIEYCTAVVIAHHKNRKVLSPFIKAALGRCGDIGTYFTGQLIKTPKYGWVR